MPVPDNLADASKGVTKTPDQPSPDDNTREKINANAAEKKKTNEAVAAAAATEERSIARDIAQKHLDNEKKKAEKAARPEEEKKAKEEEAKKKNAYADTQKSGHDLVGHMNAQVESFKNLAKSFDGMKKAVGDVIKLGVAKRLTREGPAPDSTTTADTVDAVKAAAAAVSPEAGAIAAAAALLNTPKKENKDEDDNKVGVGLGK